MIYYKKDLPDGEYFELFIPDFIVKFELKDDETINENDVTCIYLFHPMMQPSTLKFMGIEFYQTIDNTVLEEYSVNGNKPNQVYIFKGKPFNIEFIQEKYSDKK